MNLEPMLLWLIDDENVNDDLIEEFCELRHIRFCTFRTPHQAHARLADPSQPQPDIVLLDYEFRNVPGTDRWPSGLAYLPELRRVLRTDAVVMLFTQHFSADYQLVAEAIRLGADGVLHKESDHGELEAAYRLASARVVSTPESIRKDALELHRRIQADDDCKHVLSREVRDAQPQDRVVFLITPFPTEGDDESLSTTLEHVSRKLERRGYVGIRSNRFMPNKARLWEWVAAHLHMCERAVVILHRRDTDPDPYFNPNVMAEMGYFMALPSRVPGREGRPVLLLNSLTEPLPADFAGVLYCTLERGDEEASVETALKTWLDDGG